MAGLDEASAAARMGNAWLNTIGLAIVSRAAQEADSQANSTTALINELHFSAAKSIRTSIITLASFNVLAATVTVACVLRDCWAAAKRTDPNLTLRELRFTFVNAHQVYPLVLSLGVIVQGIIFAIAQSRGLGALNIEGCIPISQMMMPATFLVPYIQLIFGLETTLRAFRNPPFPPRKKWTVAICLAVVIAALIALYSVTLSLKPPDSCFASLFWYTQAWRPVCFGLLTGIAAALLAGICVIAVRLRQAKTSADIDRQAASHMVYYMVVAAASTILLIPFFFSITFADQDDSAESPMELSTVASIVANLSGLITGGLYLFLRSKQLSNGPWQQANVDLKDPEKGRRWTTDTHRESDQLYQPPPSPSVYSEPDREDDRILNNYGEKDNSRGAPMADSLRERGSIQETPSASLLMPPKPTASGWTSGEVDTRTQSRRSSFSIITPDPSRPESGSPGLLPSTTYTPTSERMLSPNPEATLMPPPLFHAPGMGWHNRNSSVGSSATVQIGLRLSNMNDARALHTSQAPPRGSRLAREVMPPTNPPAFKAPSPPAGVKGHSRAASSLDKQLPNIPKDVSTPRPAIDEDDQPQLSAAVYEPQKQPPRAKLASPRGVGFQVTPRDRVARPKGPASPDATSSAENAGWI